MPAPSSNGGGYNFGRARVVAGILCFALVAVLEMIDALSTNYAVDLPQVGLLVGTGTILLGVDPIRRIIDGDH